LVQQCGWAKCRSGALALTDAGKGILERFTPDKFRAGLSLALANDEFDELNRVNHIRGQSGKARRYLSKPGLRKTALREAMQPFPAGQWIKFEEARRIAEASPEHWGVLQHSYSGLYFAELQYGCIQEAAGINRQFLRAFLMESLATLGVVDIAFIYPHRLWPDLSGLWGTDDLYFCGRYDGLLYVRLNPLGAYALGFSEDYDLRAEAKAKLFRVLPNHDLVLAHGPLNPADRATLELIALPRSDVVWTLDTERMLTHVESGGALRELRDFLEANATEGLPETVRVFLAGLEAKLGCCTARRDAVLLEWTADALVELTATSAGTNRLCFYAGQNRLVVPAQHVAAFARAAKRLGYVIPQAP
jgi:hypothetical protein